MATIYVRQQGAVIGKTDQRLVVRKKRAVLYEVPGFKVDRVVVFGNASFTTPAIRFILDSGIDVVYLSASGRYRGRLENHLSKNALLRQAQYRRSLQPDFCLELSKRVVAGKIQNTMAFCKRQRKKPSEFERRMETLEKTLRKLPECRTLDQVRGLEGAATAAYFDLFRKFLKVDLGFRRRVFHPPKDPINALLSLGYTFLYNEMYAAISIVGLDPYQGFFHQCRHGHAALASDLIEEWRAVLVDSVVLSLINNGELGRKDFRRGKKGSTLTREGLKRFARRYDHRLQRETDYPRLGIRTSHRHCLELQARQVANVIQGKAEAYMPIKAKS